MHILCTICSDLVNQAESIYATKCGHIFHHKCLAQWIERSQSCPQCRNKVTTRCMFRVYPTISSDVTGEDAATLQSRLDNVQLQLREQAIVCRDKDDQLAAVALELKKHEDSHKAMQKKLMTQLSAVTAFKERVEYLKIQNKEVTKLKEENDELKKNMQTLTGLQKVLNATSDEVEQMLEGYTDVKTIATFATALKRALCESESKKNESRDRLVLVKQQLAHEKKICTDWQAKYMQIQENLSKAERKYELLKNKRKASDIFEDSSFNAKVYRVSDVSETVNETFAVPSNNISINTMVNRIENAESPYLNLKQSNLALSTLQRPTQSDKQLKPSEYAILNTAIKKPGTENRPSNNQKTDHSIFHRKAPTNLDLDEKVKPNLDISYDGLGGHSKLDTFPVPKVLSLKPKSSVPKLSSKHKLKRPNSDNHDIGAMIERLRNK